MGLITDAVNVLMKQAGKTGSADRELLEAMVSATIEDINRKINQGVLRLDDTISVTSGTATYELPIDFAAMIMIGPKTDTGDRVGRIWDRISEAQFAEGYEHGTVLQSGTVQAYIFIEQSASKRAQIQLIPSPTSSFTAKIIYYANLTDKNVDKMGWVQPILNGVKRQMPKWFNDHQKAERDYRVENDLEIER